MTATEGQAPRPDPAEPADDARVLRAVEEYQAAREAGCAPDRRAFLARHADIADALAECLDGLDFIQAAAPPLQLPAEEPAAGTLPTEGQPGTSAC